MTERQDRPRAGVLGLALVLALAVPACTEEDAGDQWLARVDGTTITLADFESRFRRVQKDMGEIPVLDPGGVRALKNRVLGEMVDEALLLAEAQRRGIAAAAGEVAAEKELLKDNMSERDWRRYLLEQYVDEVAWDKGLRRSLTTRKLMDQVVEAAGPVSEGAVKEYYEANIEQYRRPKEANLYQIVVDDEAAARELRERLREGADFESLARDHSMGPEARRGGALGYMRAGDLPASFATAFQLEPGEVSEIVPTEYGHHIFRIKDVRESYVQPLTAVAGEIRRQLAVQQRRALRRELLDRLRQERPIDINSELWRELLELN